MPNNGILQPEPTVNGTVATFDSASQTATGSYVPTTTGYMGPWVWSTNGPVPIGSAGAYGWTSGVSPPVGPQAATGWVPGLPEQARGTASAVPNQNPLANPAVSSVTAPSTVNPMTGTSESPDLQSDVSANATGSSASPSVDQCGINGWPVNIPSAVLPPGTAGWVMGLPEQARGTALATVRGIAGPMVVSQQIPDIISQQRAPTVPASTSGPGAANSAQMAAPEGSEASKPKNLLKLLPYNGEESLETFLAKLDYMAKQLKWKDADKFFHLCASLEGPAGQVLCSLKPDATADSVISLLHTRFGNELQIERFHAELRARRRRHGESLQSLYLDVTCMVALAHPTSVPDLTQHVTKEAFINALGDDKLQICVMDKQPTTIEEDLGIAGRLEAYECTLRAQDAPPSEFSKGEGGGGRARNKHVYTVEHEKSGAGQQLQRQMQKLQKELANLKVQGQSKGQSTSKPNTNVSASIPLDQAHLGSGPRGAAAGRSKGRGRGRGRGQGSGPPQGEPYCNNCKASGHWTRDCWSQAEADPTSRSPELKAQCKALGLCFTCYKPGHFASDCPQRKVQPICSTVLFCSSERPKAYVNAEFHGHSLHCMLDTGCDRSVIGRRLLVREKISPSGYTFTAAGQNPLKADGDVHIQLSIEGTCVSIARIGRTVTWM